MKYRKQLAVVLAGLLALSGIAMASGEDFLITLSWLEEHLTEEVNTELEDGLEQLEEDILEAASGASASQQNTQLTAAEIDALAAQAAAKVQPGGSSN